MQRTASRHPADVDLPSSPPRVTVLVPTRNEADNVQPLLDRLRPALSGVRSEVLFVDDSDDQTPDRVCRAVGGPGMSVRLLHREPAERRGGLGGAVHAGLLASAGQWVVVMDGDLQHPPETVPQLLLAGDRSGADVVVASRHVQDGSSGGLAGWGRVAVSGGATTLAKLAFPRRLHGTTDPMSGFFAVRRDAVDPASLRPDGFKILLEVLIRSRQLRVTEVGFAFADRHSGDSKASWREGVRYLRALLRLRASTPGARALAFAAVGASGIGVNLAAVLLLASVAGLHYLLAAALATQVSSLWNSLLTEHLVFADRAVPQGRFRRLTRSWLLNNAVLLLRLPLLALLVERVGLDYLLATFLTLLAGFAGRFSVTDRYIYPSGGSMTATTDRITRREPVDVVVDLNARPTTRSATPYLPHRYDIPGLATVGSDVPLKELEWFRNGTVGRGVDIAVRVGAVGGPPRRRARMTQHVGPAGVAYEEHLGRLGANFRVELGDTIEVTAGPLLARSPHVLYTNVIEALLRFQAVSRGRMLLHSACLEIDGRGVLLSARTDTGKTGTVLTMLRAHGARFLSDDMTILEQDGTARCFPKPLTISQHTLQALGITDLSPAEWRRLRVQSRLHSKEGRAFGTFLADHNLPIMGTNALTQIVIPPPKYDVRRLVPCDVVQQVAVSDLFVIERGAPGREEIGEPDLLRELIENTDDAYGFPPFRYFAPALVFGEADYLTLRERERDILRTAMQGIRGQRLTSDSFSWAADIAGLLQAGRGAAADAQTAASIRDYLAEQRTPVTEPAGRDLSVSID